jgi:adenine-specific DNA-methyltransferase
MTRHRKKESDEPSLFRGVSHPLSTLDTQVIYCGDNLEQLKKFPDACVDLIYIDPPFNSNRNYEVFWGEARETRAFEDRHESTMAYLDFMRPRCMELARVLKKTGSFYYHCDWHASHYAKVMLDQIIGEDNFQNEIVWKRSSAHSNVKQGGKNYGRVHDVLLFYTKGHRWTFNPQYVPYSQEYIESHYRYVEEGTGRRYRKGDLTANKPGGDTSYEWTTPDNRKVQPYPGRYWAYTKEKMKEFERQGRLVYTKTGMPEYKRYLDEMPGQPLQDVWDDIPPINSQATERVGYPTQKPLPLLERIIKASTDPDDIVLDAFCGCGTALIAAEKLDRRWIGIDISPTACRVMADRLRKDCGLLEGKHFRLRDLPRSEKQLREMPFFEFENWAVVALGGIPNKAKVGDKGIDGRIYPASVLAAAKGKKSGDFDFMDIWHPVQVKQKDKAGRPDIDAFETAMQRANRTLGFFVAFDFTSDALAEIRGFRKRTGLIIVPLTVRQILDGETEGEITVKLA